MCIRDRYGEMLHHTLKNQLKKQNVVLASKANNKLKNKLKFKNKNISFDEYDSTGVYRLNCSDCSQFYIGQTGRSFKLRYKEHIPISKSNIGRSTFAEHLSLHDHNIKSISESLDILHKYKKSHKLDTLECFEIYKATK